MVVHMANAPHAQDCIYGLNCPMVVELNYDSWDARTLHRLVRDMRKPSLKAVRCWFKDGRQPPIWSSPWKI